MLAARRGAGGSVVGRRRGNHGVFLAFALIPSLVRWSLLGGIQERIFVPGEDEPNWTHVICRHKCGNQWWERAYSPDTVKSCGDHEEGRVPMIECEECLATPGLHPPPEDWQ